MYTLNSKVYGIFIIISIKFWKYRWNGQIPWKRQLTKSNTWNCYYMQIAWLYIEKPKDSTQKLLDLINEPNKVAGYKINIQKSIALLYTNNETSENECKKYLLK